MRSEKQLRQEIQMVYDEITAIEEEADLENRERTAHEYKMTDKLLDKMDILKKEFSRVTRMSNYRHLMEDPTDDYKIIQDPIELSGDGWSSFGEMLQATIQAGTPGGRVSHKLRESRAASGLNETVPSEGGFLVGTDFSSELIDSIYKTGTLAKRCRRIVISQNSNAVSIPGIDESSRATGSRAGGIRVFNLEEAGEKEKSKPKFRKVALELSKKIGLCYLTDELVQDSSALESYVRNGFAKEFSFVVDDEIIRGNGTGGAMLGILNSAALVTISKETGQSAGGIVYENILKLFARFNGNIQTAVFLAHRSTIPALFSMNLALGTAGAAVFTPSEVQLGRTASLFGVPLLFHESCSAVGTVGDLILMDPATYLIGEKKGAGLQVDTSIHVRFNKQGPCISNGTVQSSLIRGNLSLVKDTAIPSKVERLCVETIQEMPLAA